MTDVRWEQRLASYSAALAQLTGDAQIASSRNLTEIEKRGLIQAFEFTHELAWNLMKDYFEFIGAASVMGSRDAFRQAFRSGLISDGETWMEMIQSRKQSTHTYNQATADAIVAKATSRYVPLLKEFELKMRSLKGA